MTVTLYYRGAGDATFTAKPMKWRYKELVARIPAAKMAGNVDPVLHRGQGLRPARSSRSSGKSTSPNLVNIDARRAAALLPRLDRRRRGADGRRPASTKHHDEERSAAHKASTSRSRTSTDGDDVDGRTVAGRRRATASSDVGSTKFEKAKWVSTGTAGALLAGSLTFYILAGKQADNLVADSQDSRAATPPCRAFDHDYDQAWQDAGQRYNTISNVTLVVGVGRRRRRRLLLVPRAHGEEARRAEGRRTSTASPETTWVVVPTVGRRVQPARPRRRGSSHAQHFALVLAPRRPRRARRTRPTSAPRRSCAAARARSAPTATRATRTAGGARRVRRAGRQRHPGRRHAEQLRRTTARSSRTTSIAHGVADAGRRRGKTTSRSPVLAICPAGDKDTYAITITAEGRTSRSLIDVRQPAARRSGAILNSGGIADRERDADRGTHGTRSARTSRTRRSARTTRRCSARRGRAATNNYKLTINVTGP